MTLSDDASRTPGEVIILDQVRAERKAAKRMIGWCGKGSRDECGMKDAAECRIHGQKLHDPDAS